jgi:hypothetical protein
MGRAHTAALPLYPGGLLLDEAGRFRARSAARNRDAERSVGTNPQDVAAGAPHADKAYRRIATVERLDRLRPRGRLMRPVVRPRRLENGTILPFSKEWKIELHVGR